MNSSFEKNLGQIDTLPMHPAPQLIDLQSREVKQTFRPLFLAGSEPKAVLVAASCSCGPLMRRSMVVSAPIGLLPVNLSKITRTFK